MESDFIPYSAVRCLPGRSVLVLAPHPDDEVFGCGGAIMRHVEAGVPLHIVVLTDGAHGKEGAERAVVAETRRRESIAAAAAMGAPAPEFWELRDRELGAVEELVQRLLEAIDRTNADLIYAPSLAEIHPDHQALAVAVTEAARRCNTFVRIAYYEVGVPLRPNTLLDISDVAARKQCAMACFSSQLTVQAYEAHIAALNRYRTYTLSADVTSAEAFQVVESGGLPQLSTSSDAAEEVVATDTPLISVIVRSMGRDLLQEALGSLAAQTYPNIEIVVVNAKGPKHPPLPERCGRFPLRLLGTGEALQRSRAANTGLDAVRGEYFSFLDDDDTFDPDHFARLVAARRKNSGDVVVSYAGVRSVDRDDPDRTVLNIFADQFDETKLLAGNFIPIHAPLVPVSLLTKGIRFDESLDVYEDWDFWLQVARHARFELVDQVTATYFMQGASGVNPLKVTEDSLRKATLALYAKWLPRLETADLWQLSRLYHDRNLALHSAYAEVESLKRDVYVARQSLEGERAHLQRSLDFVDGELAAVRAELAGVYHSRSWRITAPLRAVFQRLRRMADGDAGSGSTGATRSWLGSFLHLLRFVYRAVKHYGGPRRFLRKAWGVYRVEGWAGLSRRLPLRRRKMLDAARFGEGTYHARELVTEITPELVPSGGIVVVAHVYYPELFEQMAVALDNIPWPFDLCISVTQDQARQTVQERALKLRRVSRLDVRVVPNRGRDIAPLLVEFADALRSHRFVLHLHTKKSLYSGRERVEWRDYLVDGLLGSEQRIRHVFQQFVGNDDIGIIYPETFEGVPYWAHTWLQNKGIAMSLAARLGIDITKRRYLDAPMGSMFWARTDALRPLIDLRLGYQDFPEELGQTDGTLQHTIERAFVPVANAAGLAQRVMLAADGGATLFLSPGQKNLHQYFVADVRSRLLAAAADAKVVSFDIFDTLLVRPWFTPGNLFAFMEDVVHSRFGISGFAELRREAEHLARMGSQGGDVGIAAIYEALGKLCGRPDQMAELQALEEGYERAGLRPRPDTCEVARNLHEKGKRVLLISDMYLAPSFIRGVLEQNDLGSFDGLYVSSETGLRKDRGDLWAEIPVREKTSIETWLHVGDDEHSDIQRPLDAGYAHPVHIMRAADQFLLFNEEAERWIHPEAWQEGLLLGLMANRIFLPGRAHRPIGATAQDRTIEINSLRDLGYLVLGPALTVFMAWLMREARRDGVSKLLYASREGHLLKQAHDLVASRQKTPEGVYFLCSRRSATFASIKDRASLENLLKAHFAGSFADFLQKRLGIDDLAPFEQRLGDKRLRRPGALPDDVDRYENMLGECLDLLTEQATFERERYEKYALGIIGKHRAALVDIGYSATIQRSLGAFLDGIAGGYYFVTVEQSAVVDGLGQYAKGCFGHRINAFHSGLPLYEYSLLFEAALTAPHGQFVGFCHPTDDAAPCYKPPGLAQQHFGDIEEMHQGALEYLTDVLDVVGDFFEHLADAHSAVNLPVRQVMNYRWKLGLDSPALHVEDSYSGNAEVSIFDFYEKKRQSLPGLFS